MKQWTPQQVAAAAGARLIAAPTGIAGPELVVIDSRAAGPGALFIGLPGERAEGGSFAGAALERGAWGVLVSEAYAASAPDGPGVVLACDDPLAALQSLARA